MNRNAHIAVVGATGAVGQQILSALLDREHPPEKLTALGSDRSEGDEIEYGDDTIQVERATPDAFRGVALALLAVPGDAARTLAVAAQEAGAWAVDVSPTFRADPEVPLVLPAVNLDALRAPFRGRIVACPSATTSALATTLEALAGLGPTDVHVTALVGASSSGQRGVEELEQQTAALLSGRELEPSLFPHRLAFNVIPQVGAVEGDATLEERGWEREASRLGGAMARARVSGTALQVPTFYGHLLTLAVRLNARPSLDEVRGALRAFRALKVLDSPAERVYPMPMLVTADSAIHVGRVRAAPDDEGWFHLVAAIDNAGRGAALNAVEVGELLLGGQGGDGGGGGGA